MQHKTSNLHKKTDCDHGVSLHAPHPKPSTLDPDDEATRLYDKLEGNMTQAWRFLRTAVSGNRALAIGHERETGQLKRKRASRAIRPNVYALTSTAHLKCSL